MKLTPFIVLSIMLFSCNRNGNVTFTGEMEFLGTQRFDHNKSGKFLIEKSEIYGYLKYTRQ